MSNRYDPRAHHRRSIRLAGYDYSQEGAYSLTLCSHGKECIFGDVDQAGVALNEWGQAVAECWQWLEQQYPYVRVDTFVVMPNHTHGIVLLMDERGDGWDAGAGVSGARRVGSGVCGGGSRTGPGKWKPLGRLVGAFKTVSTRRINEVRGTPGAPIWQRNYFERIIRSDEELNRIRDYIVSNPARWAEDEENPMRVVRGQRPAPLQCDGANIR